MTTWQEEPPLSRRALRESERAHAQATLSRGDDVLGEQGSDQQVWSGGPGPEPLHYTTQARPQAPHYDGQSFRSRQSSPAQSPTEAQGYRLRDFSPEARGASFTATQPTPHAPWAPQPAGSGDLDYHTSVEGDRPAPAAPAAPIAVPPNLGASTEAAPVAEVPIPAPEAAPDFTMSRRALRALRDAAAPAVEAQVAPLVAPVSVAPVSAAPVSAAPAPAAAAAVFAAPTSAAPQPFPLVAPKSDPSAEIQAAMAEFDALYQIQSAPVPTAAQPPAVSPPAVPAVAAPAVEDNAVDAAGQLHELIEPVAPISTPPVSMPPVSIFPVAAPLVPAPPVLAPPVLAPPVLAPPVSAPTVLAPPMPAPSAPVQNVPMQNVPVQSIPAPAPSAAPEVAIPAPSSAAPLSAASASATLDPVREIVTAPEIYTRPIGHWSTQAGIDDGVQPAEHVLSRDLAASDAITTSALVLPSFPQSGPITGPVSGTGEILVTGSLDLPRSLGMSGRYPNRYDSADVDSIIDGIDREDAAPDSAPVRAIRAVSTHTSSQGIIAAKRPKGNNLPMILSITAGVMMVSVVVLFVAGMIFKIF